LSKVDLQPLPSLFQKENLLQTGLQLVIPQWLALDKHLTHTTHRNLTMPHQAMTLRQKATSYPFFMQVDYKGGQPLPGILY
jgi:hypothetical protein